MVIEEPQEVEFLSEDESLDQPQRVVEKARGEIIAWLFKIGIAKTEKAANRVMLLVALIGFIITFYILFKFAF